MLSCLWDGAYERTLAAGMCYPGLPHDQQNENDFDRNNVPQ